MESDQVKQQICPVQCKYCMAEKIDGRSRYWNAGYRIGVNKTCTFINRFPEDPPLSEMTIPWEAMAGEYVGFEGASDCMWSEYRSDLEWLIAHIDEFNIRKLILTTKIPNVPVQLLSQNKRICVVFSLTGLDALEKTKTQDRLNAMIRLKDAGVEVHAIIHPYIHQYSNLSFITKFKEAGFNEIGLKGFRYNPKTMALAEIPSEVLNQYKGQQNEEEVGLTTAKRWIESKGVAVKGLRELVHTDRTYFHIFKDQAEQDAACIFKSAVISSSDPKQTHIYQAIINRKMYGKI